MGIKIILLVVIACRWYRQTVRFCFNLLLHNIDSLNYSFSLCLLSIMPLIPVPYQHNGCDCAVFVCRYAYSLYVSRHLCFTWDDYTQRPPFHTLIAKGPTFQFDDSDIKCIRVEMSTLIGRLSVLYLQKLNEQKKANRTKRR